MQQKQRMWIDDLFGASLYRYIFITTPNLASLSCFLIHRQSHTGIRHRRSWTKDWNMGLNKHPSSSSISALYSIPWALSLSLHSSGRDLWSTTSNHCGDDDRIYLWKIESRTRCVGRSLNRFTRRWGGCSSRLDRWAAPFPSLFSEIFVVDILTSYRLK